jgi:hypothetical protein
MISEDMKQFGRGYPGYKGNSMHHRYQFELFEIERQNERTQEDINHYCFSVSLGHFGHFIQSSVATKIEGFYIK